MLNTTIKCSKIQEQLKNMSFKKIIARERKQGIKHMDHYQELFILVNDKKLQNQLTICNIPDDNKDKVRYENGKKQQH